MNGVRNIFYLFIAGLLLSAGVQAFDLEDTASYSATRVITSDQGEFRAKVYHAPKKERMEITASGQSMATIIRLDKQVAWQLMPQMNMYMEIPISKIQQQDPSKSNVIERKKLGREVVNGHEATKWKVKFQDDEGNRGEGYYWFTDDNVPIKLEVDVGEGEGKGHYVMELVDLQVGKQPKKLFEIPEGYSTMGGMLGGQMDALKKQTAAVNTDEDSETSGMVQQEVDNVKRDSIRTTADEVSKSISKGIRGLFD